MKFLDNKGLNAIDLVYMAIVLIVGLGIYAGIDTTYSTSGWGAPALAAKGNTSAGVYGGFLTLANAPQIMAAVIILGIVGFLVMRK